MAIVKIHNVHKSAERVSGIRGSQAYAVLHNDMSSTSSLQSVVHNFWRFTSIYLVYLYGKEKNKALQQMSLQLHLWQAFISLCAKKKKILVFNEHITAYIKVLQSPTEKISFIDLGGIQVSLLNEKLTKQRVALPPQNKKNIINEIYGKNKMCS